MTQERRTAAADDAGGAEDGGLATAAGLDESGVAAVVDVPAATLPPVAPLPSRPAPPRPSAPDAREARTSALPAPPRPGPSGEPVAARRPQRPKMQLRIPDDEVSRPTPAASAVEPAITPTATPMATAYAPLVPPAPPPPTSSTRKLLDSTPPVSTSSSSSFVAAPPSSAGLEPIPAAPPISPSRIMMINGPSKPAPPIPPAPTAPPPPHVPQAPLPFNSSSQSTMGAVSAPRASSVPDVHEDSWTPYAPSVVSQLTPMPPAPSLPEIPVEEEPERISITDAIDSELVRLQSSDDIHVFTDSIPDLGLTAETVATIDVQSSVPPRPAPAAAPDREAALPLPPLPPRPAPSGVMPTAAVAPPAPPSPPSPLAALGAPPTPPPPPAPTKPRRAASAADIARSRLPTEPDGEEVQFDDDEELPRAEYVVRPPLESRSDAAELTNDDVVSVESAPVVPTPKRTSQPPPPMAAPVSGPGPVAAAPPPMTSGSTAGLPPMRPRLASIPGIVPPPVPSGQRISSPGYNQAALSPGTPSPERAIAVAQPQQVPIAQPPASPIAPPPMSDSAAQQRKKGRPWWEELFNDDFIRTMAKITDAQIAKEADFIEDSLAIQKGAMVLDLACGTGRHACEMSRRGYQVVGFDLSLAMLARAADEAQDRNQKINFLQGDMREMTFDGTFDGVYCWNTSFGFFEEEKNAQVIQRVYKALKKGGQFLLDVVNRDYVANAQPSLAWYEGEACICMDEMQLDSITSRMRVKRTMMMDDGRTKEIEYSVRLYALHELGKLLHDNGFRVAEVSGRTATPGVFFGAESPRTLVLAEKR